MYVMLGLGEALLIPMLALELWKDGGRDAAISKKVAVASIACLVPPLLWRCYVLGARPDLLGKYTDEDKSDSGQGSGTSCK